MDFSGLRIGDDPRDELDSLDRGSASRALIRAAKLVSAQGEFVCVIRDVSARGLTIRTFHELPVGEQLGLELQNGETFELEKTGTRGRDANFAFAGAVEVERLVRESWNYPKRQLRLNLALPLTATTLAGRAEAVTENFSQQGACVDCEALYAIDQTIRIEGEAMPEIRAKVRWRRDNRYGLVFDNTFSLRDFAALAARVQCPSLLRDDA